MYDIDFNNTIFIYYSYIRLKIVITSCFTEFSIMETNQ